MSDSDTASNTQERDSENSTMSQNTQSVAQISTNHSNTQTTILKLYHLVGLDNYGTWAFRMKNVLQREGLYEYCITAPSQVVTDAERKRRQLALSAINGSVKGNVAIKLLKRYTDPNKCWTSLKTRYESDSTSRQVLFIEKFFSIRKLNSMDEYLVDMKEAADSLEELDVPLPEKIMVAYTLKNLPPEYDMIKQIIMNEHKLPSYLDLEARLLNEETAKKTQNYQEKEAEALLSYRTGHRRPYHHGGSSNQGGRTSTYVYNKHNNHRDYVHPSGGYISSGSTYSSNSDPSGGFSNFGSGSKHSHQSDRYTPDRYQCNRGTGSYRGHHQRPYHNNRTRLDSFEGELKSLMSKMKDLEFRLQREDRD
jgi:hypothetical protein